MPDPPQSRRAETLPAGRDCLVRLPARPARVTQGYHWAGGAQTLDQHPQNNKYFVKIIKIHPDFLVISPLEKMVKVRIVRRSVVAGLQAVTLLQQ